MDDRIRLDSELDGRKIQGDIGHGEIWRWRGKLRGGNRPAGAFLQYKGVLHLDNDLLQWYKEGEVEREEEEDQEEQLWDHLVLGGFAGIYQV